MVINAGLGKLICNLRRSPNEHFTKIVSLSKIDNVPILLIDKRFPPISVFFVKHWNNPFDTDKCSNKHSWRFFKFKDMKRRPLLEKPQFVYLFCPFMKKHKFPKIRNILFLANMKILAEGKKVLKKTFINLVALRRTL